MPNIFPRGHAALTASKDALSSIQAIATVIALVLGAYWFYTQGSDKPRLKLEHKIDARRLSPDFTILFVDIFLTNNGNVAIRLGNETTDVHQLVPFDKKQLATLSSPKKILSTGVPDFFQSQDGTRLKVYLLARGATDWRKANKRIEPGEVDQVHREFLIRRGPQVVRVTSQFDNIAGTPFSEKLSWIRTSIFDIDTLNASSK